VDAAASVMHCTLTCSRSCAGGYVSLGWATALQPADTGPVAMYPSGDYVLWADSSGAPQLSFRTLAPGAGYVAPAPAPLPARAAVAALSLAGGVLSARLTLPLPPPPPRPTTPSSATYREGWLIWCVGPSHPASLAGELVTHGATKGLDYGGAVLNLLCAPGTPCVVPQPLQLLTQPDRVALAATLAPFAAGLIWRALRWRLDAAERLHQLSLAALSPALARLLPRPVAGWGLAELGWLAAYGSLIGLYLRAAQALYPASPARAVGSLLMPLMAAALLPVQRRSVFNAALGLSFERAIAFHKLAAAGAAAATVAHVALVARARGARELANAQSTEYGHGSAWGTASAALMAALLLLSHPAVRARYWELFRLSHAALAPAALALAYWHATKLGWFLLPLLILHGLDKLAGLPLHALPAQLQPLPDGSVRLAVPTRLSRAPGAGQFVWLCAPALSPIEWHPFSCAGGGGGDEPLLLLVKPMGPGSWTARLAALAAGGARATAVMLDGPHGRLSLRLSRYAVVLLVAGGHGITPFPSVVAELERSFAAQRGLGPLVAAGLVWAARSRGAFDALPGLLPRLERSALFARPQLHLTTAEAEGDETRYARLLAEFESAQAETRAGWKRREGAQPRRLLQGRPDMFGSVAEHVRLAAWHGQPPSSVAVLVCGPQALVAEALEAAAAYGCHAHAETFGY